MDSLGHNFSYSFCLILFCSKLYSCFVLGLKLCMFFGHYRHFCLFLFSIFKHVNLFIFFRLSDAMSGYFMSATPPIFLKLCICIIYGLKMCMWFGNHRHCSRCGLSHYAMSGFFVTAFLLTVLVLCSCFVHSLKKYLCFGLKL